MNNNLIVNGSLAPDKVFKHSIQIYYSRREGVDGSAQCSTVMRSVGEWVSTGVGKRDNLEGDTVEVARLGG